MKHHHDQPQSASHGKKIQEHGFHGYQDRTKGAGEQYTRDDDNQQDHLGQRGQDCFFLIDSRCCDARNPDGHRTQAWKTGVRHRADIANQTHCGHHRHGVCEKYVHQHGATVRGDVHSHQFWMASRRGGHVSVQHQVMECGHPRAQIHRPNNFGHPIIGPQRLREAHQPPEIAHADEALVSRSLQQNSDREECASSSHTLHHLNPSTGFGAGRKPPRGGNADFDSTERPRDHCHQGQTPTERCASMFGKEPAPLLPERSRMVASQVPCQPPRPINSVSDHRQRCWQERGCEGHCHSHHQETADSNRPGL